MIENRPPHRRTVALAFSVAGVGVAAAMATLALALAAFRSPAPWTTLTKKHFEAAAENLKALLEAEAP